MEINHTRTIKGTRKKTKIVHKRSVLRTTNRARAFTRTLIKLCQIERRAHSFPCNGREIADLIRSLSICIYDRAALCMFWVLYVAYKTCPAGYK